jgi:hypothetical protein
MMKKRYLCEKHSIKGDGPDYIKVIVYEFEEESKYVIDITHQDTEEEADEWLDYVWALKPAPKLGEQFEFERFDDPSKFEE